MCISALGIQSAQWKSLSRLVENRADKYMDSIDPETTTLGTDVISSKYHNSSGDCFLWKAKQDAGCLRQLCACEAEGGFEVCRDAIELGA